ncbi:MAG: M23 family metallopeptidase, partial [Candidatus Rokubacteria bacterium]|nr:M23 family metallopeptidase [Candidatus Rokubacteria bacterium]
FRVGERIRIPPGPGVFHLVEEGETLERLAERYRVEREAIAKANRLGDEPPLWVGEELFIPGAKPSALAAAAARFLWPVRGRITDRFGWRPHPLSGADGFHRGIDIAAPLGRPFVAARAGRVVFSGWRQDYGRTIVLDHGGGVQTLYAHNSANLVSVGQWVRQGEVIGRVGESGGVTGPHLHFEVLRGATAVNPLLALRK